MTDARHVAVYGEVDANLIDGSSVWLQSICLTLVTLPEVRVTLLLRVPIERRMLLQPLLDHPRVRVVEPGPWLSGRHLGGEEAAAALAALDAEDRFDFVLLRGSGVVAQATLQGHFDGRIWLYHVPVPGDEPAAIAKHGSTAHRVLCQTEAIRRHVGTVAPAIRDRLILLPPMIPSVPPPQRRHAGPVRRLVYAGKFSPEYFFFEMVELLGRLRETDPTVELHVAGDKIHNPPGDPAFRERARAALEDTDGLIWHGAVPRDRAASLAKSSDLALSIRDPSLDQSVEMSTKVLEYGAVGCPVLLNLTPFHTEMLGADYPLMVSDLDGAVAAIQAASEDPELREDAAGRLRSLSEQHTYEQVAAGLADHLADRTVALRRPPAAVQAERGPRLLVAGHNLLFAETLLSRAKQHGASVREDLWAGHSGGDEIAGRDALAWAEVVLCEWCLGNAVWYSRNMRDDQRLVVRFHRMELETPFPGEVDLDRVDTMVFVARHVLETACERFGWDPRDPRFAVIPNAVDLELFARPKLPGSEFNLGMVGFVPRVKRLDRAIRVLERLRAHDERYQLVVKGRGPWEYRWMAVRDDERRYYQQVFRRIRRSRLLGSAVSFEPFGADVDAYLQQIGWLISASEIEGHSVAVGEAMAAATVPVIIDRPGAAAQYEQCWVHDDPERAADWIIECARTGSFARHGGSAADFAGRWGWAEIWPRWVETLGLGPD